ncbi:A1 family peptidase [Neiella marina]|uniref:A1 family peptidase n=1 Tax=Neiella holothuriorum TaxID=2870530 RepID=A0ABS7EC94_9GAMM|nr:pepsin-like aspartic protease [Neiella holothuriorum]MBW8189824.1 A1 family peptidase [Neiella holothuriorum]
MTSAKTIKLPITNVYASGDYTATFHIGSEKSPVNLLLDSGSSTLVLDHQSYHAAQDSLLEATTLAQEVTYGVGGWDGPVIKTQVTVEHAEDAITLPECHVALISNKEQHATFGKGNGILGLAYRHLNKSYDLAHYIEQHQVQPPHTYPWPFGTPECVELGNAHFNSDDLKQFKKFLWQQPEQDLIPYFTQIEELGLTANKWSFYSKRSSIHVTCEKADDEALKADPLNQGYLVLGGGEEHSELYQGDFKTIDVMHDCYYNVVLTKFQVGDGEPIAAAPIDKAHEHNYFTNAIVDTGCSVLALTNDLFQHLEQSLNAISAEFAELIAPFKDMQFMATGIDASKLDLSKWPDLHFYFASAEHGDQRLTCKPSDYWQINSPTPGKAVFKIISQLPNWPNQSLIGLPLLNDYYVVFDRAEHELGVIRFAQQK